MNDAAPLKLTFTTAQLEGVNREVVRYKQDTRIPENASVDLKRIMRFIGSDDDNAKLFYQGGEKENFLPTRHFYLDVDTAKVRSMNMLAPDDMGQMVSRMDWTIDNGMLMKNDLITLDIVANNLMEHPIYFAVSTSPSAYMGLSKYFQLEGLTYRIMPEIKSRRFAL